MVQMQNGCICCTLREDLLLEVANLAREGRFDYLLIESTGIASRPRRYAEALMEPGEDTPGGEAAQIFHTSTPARRNAFNPGTLAILNLGVPAETQSSCTDKPCRPPVPVFGRAFS